MPRRLALAAVLMLAACAARAPVDDAVRPAPAGITPLTLEQDDQIGGLRAADRIGG